MNQPNVRAKMSLAHKGVRFSLERRQNMKVPHNITKSPKRKPHSEATKAKMRISANRPDTKQKKSLATKKRWASYSKEEKQKILRPWHHATIGAHVSKIETKLLNEIENLLALKIERQFCIDDEYWGRKYYDGRWKKCLLKLMASIGTQNLHKLKMIKSKIFLLKPMASRYTGYQYEIKKRCLIEN